jgi:K+-sensing histidine kinase KdpD
MARAFRELGCRLRGHWLFGPLAGIASSLLLVAAVTALIAFVLLFYRLEHVTILYLVPVLVAALLWGVIPAIIAAIAGVAAPAFFFYPPVYDFRVRNPDQIIDLVLFILVAVVTGQLGTRVRQARLRAQAESLRDALIGSVSHELRTPLASIIGSASVLAESPAVRNDEQLSSLVQVMRKEGERLNSDIQNLLDATRISSEGIRPRLAWVDPEDIVNGALARKRSLLADRPVIQETDDDLPLVYVDPALLETALDQLIANAVKYSPAGTPITITASRIGNSIEIKVVDQGEGLRSDERERIFDRFYRSPRHINAIPGSGLGLWIARALIEACGGRVRASSAGPGHGTTMRVDLPVEAQPAPDEHADD